MAEGWATISASAVLLGHPLLVDLLAVNTVREALEVGGTIAQRGEHRAEHPPVAAFAQACDAAVIVDHRTFGAGRPKSGEEHLVAVGDSDGDAVDVDLLGGSAHPSTLTHGTMKWCAFP
jgi:hypothetical protein